MSKPPKGEKLTAKQRRWCELVIEGKSDCVAYQEAYECTRENAVAKAYLLRKDSGIMVELEKMRKASFEHRKLSTEEKEAILCDIARSSEKNTDRVRAINEHNRMTGGHSAEKVVEDGIAGLIEAIREPKE